MRTGGCHWHEDNILQGDGETDHLRKKDVDNDSNFVGMLTMILILWEEVCLLRKLRNMVIGDDLHIIKTRISWDKLSVLI